MPKVLKYGKANKWGVEKIFKVTIMYKLSCIAGIIGYLIYNLFFV